jgi:hypothetical protein
MMKLDDYHAFISVADPGYLFLIRMFSIPDPGSRVKKIPASAEKKI